MTEASRFILESVGTRSGSQVTIQSLLQRLWKRSWDRPLTASMLARFVAMVDGLPAGDQTSMYNALMEVDIIGFQVAELVSQAAAMFSVPAEDLENTLGTLCYERYLRGQGNNVITLESGEIDPLLFQAAIDGRLQIFQPVMDGSQLRFWHSSLSKYLAAKVWAAQETSLENAYAVAGKVPVLQDSFRYLLQFAAKHREGLMELDFRRRQANLSILSMPLSSLSPLVSLTLVLAGSKFKAISELSSLEHLDQLRQFTLDLSNCPNLASIDGLGEALTGLISLEVLTLSLEETPVQDVSELGRGLSCLACLQKFDINLQHSQITGTSELELSLQRLGLRELSMNLSLCKQLSFSRVESRLPASLEDVTLELHSIKDAGVISHVIESLAGLTQIVKLSINLGETCLRDSSELNYIWQLRTLQNLKLSLMGAVMAHVEDLGAGLSQLTQLQNFMLDVSQCWKLQCIAEIEKTVSRLPSLCNFALLGARTRIGSTKRFGEHLT
ncbi:unnamed protein product, partial [Polarella glacialis]